MRRQLTFFCSSNASSGVATGGGAECHPDSEKNAKNQEKEVKNREIRGKIRKKRQKSERFFHFAPPDRQGWLRYWMLECILIGCRISQRVWISWRAKNQLCLLQGESKQNCNNNEGEINDRHHTLIYSKSNSCKRLF